MMPTIGGGFMDPTNLQSLDPKTMSADQGKQLEALNQIFNGPLGGGGPLGAKLKEMIDAYHSAHPDTQQA
ncbi:hypothetical protein KQH49_14105 [Mycetohabitans sp. B5]|uniref:Uncharacterized protein n=1 Tax=Mycetohabitans endofungorum TaxID=417203 RepID=A0A2P5K6T6_9BURK|nr:MULTISPECIES: hypothetical protein [Mycetohabitans]MCG1055994.1 hypothetical protein [Mycetohabitans sp. B5]PPB81025.1 hypothetical protein B0O95_12310 [Mycetohabitans endofungorum]